MCLAQAVHEGPLVWVAQAGRAPPVCLRKHGVGAHAVSSVWLQTAQMGQSFMDQSHKKQTCNFFVAVPLPVVASGGPSWQVGGVDRPQLGMLL